MGPPGDALPNLDSGTMPYRDFLADCQWPAPRSHPMLPPARRLQLALQAVREAREAAVSWPDTD
jgi:hypothetical protein